MCVRACVYIILGTNCLPLLPLLFLGINLVNGLSSQEQTPKGLGALQPILDNHFLCPVMHLNFLVTVKPAMLAWVLVALRTECEVLISRNLIPKMICISHYASHCIITVRDDSLICQTALLYSYDNVHSCDAGFHVMRVSPSKRGASDMSPYTKREL